MRMVVQQPPRKSCNDNTMKAAGRAKTVTTIEKRIQNRYAFFSASLFLHTRQFAGQTQCIHANSKEAKAEAREKLWRRFFADPSQWWDNRANKKRSRFPDFVHYETKEALWIDCWSNPSWVETELFKLKQGDGDCGHRVKAAYLQECDVNYKDAAGNCFRAAANDKACHHTQDLRRLCEAGQLDDAVDLVYQQGLHTSTNAFYCMLLECINKKDLFVGRQVHRLLVRIGLESNTFLGSCLIRMFTSCGSLSEAKHVFSKLHKRNVFAWSAIITAHAKLEQNVQAIELYYQMRHSTVQPDPYVFVSVLKACSSLENLDQGKLTHSHVIERGLVVDLFIGSALIDMYGRCGSLEDAHSVFDKLQESSVVTWNAIIAGHAQHAHGMEALQLFQKMQDGKVEPNHVTFVCILKACSSLAALGQAKVIHVHLIERGCELNAFVGNALIGAYAKCGSLADAFKVLDELPRPDVVAWSAIIAGYAQLNNYALALKCFKKMLQDSVKPNDVAYLCLISACSHDGLVYEGCHHFSTMMEDHNISPTLDHFNMLVDLLGRTGHLKEAEDLLLTMPFSCNNVGWISLLSHCKTHGDVDLAKQCFDSGIIANERRAPGFVIMSDIYAAAGMWEDAEKMQDIRNDIHAWKKPGKAYIEVDLKMHDFTVGDKSHPESESINLKLRNLYLQVKRQGYVPHADVVADSGSDVGQEDYFVHILRNWL